jgi:hypothetical protein
MIVHSLQAQAQGSLRSSSSSSASASAPSGVGLQAILEQASVTAGDLETVLASARQVERDLRTDRERLRVQLEEVDTVRSHTRELKYVNIIDIHIDTYTRTRIHMYTQTQTHMHAHTHA